MSQDPLHTATGRRGPNDHAIREQIVQAADQHFRHYGYEKTTVSDLAREIGFSKAYIYKFFESKRAIGEAICVNCTDQIIEETRSAIANAKFPTEKLRVLFRSIMEKTIEMLMSDRRIFDMVRFAVSERWSSTLVYEEQICRMLTDIVLEGRQSGEFERKTPLDETVRAILQAMKPFCHPLMLEWELDRPAERLAEVTSLVLRSLAP